MNNIIQKLNKQAGQSLIEVLLAAAVVGIALTALVSVTTAAVARNREAKERAIATRLAQETVEAYRIVRDTQGWDYLINNLLSQDSGGSVTKNIINCIDEGDIALANLPSSLFTTGDFDNPLPGNISELITRLNSVCTGSDYAGFTSVDIPFIRGTHLIYSDTDPQIITYNVIVSWNVGARNDYIVVAGELKNIHPTPEP